MFNSIARFVTRKDEATGQVDLLLGTAFKSQTTLKPNYVYELRDILGEIHFREVGPMQEHMAKQFQTHTANDMLCMNGKYLYLSSAEARNDKDVV